MQTLYSDIIGMTGTALVVLAYFLLQMERLDPKGLSYNLINLAGAGLLMVSLTYTFNLASFVIEIFWIAASLLGLWKWLGRRTSH